MCNKKNRHFWYTSQLLVCNLLTVTFYHIRLKIYTIAIAFYTNNIIYYQATILLISRCLKDSLAHKANSIVSVTVNYSEIIHTKYEDVYSFPTPKALSKATDDGLAQCDLGYRIPYIKDAITKVMTDSILADSWNSCTYEDLLSMLKTVKGVGDKVANRIMLFSYRRTTCAPIDTWIKKIIAKYYNGENPFLKYGDKAGIMQQYAFYYILHHKTEV